MKLNQTGFRDLWNYLGDFWGRYDDKETTEVWWEAILSSVVDLYKTSYWIHYSKSIQYLPPVISGINYFYDMFWGDTLPSMSGLLNVDDDDVFNPGIGPIASIDTLYNIYYETEADPHTTDAIALTSEYALSSNKEYIELQSDSVLTADANQSNINHSVLHMSGLNLVNPFLFEYWGRLVDVTSDLWTNGDYDHHLEIAESPIHPELSFYKYFIWSLVYLKKQNYTLDKLTNILAISYGMPFAFESGVVHNKDGPDESGLYTFTVSGADAEVYHNYQIPSGLGNYLTINNGDAVTAFQVFASGFYVDDYVSDSGLMNDYADSGITAYSTVVLSRVPDVSGLSYSTTFVSGLIEDTVPKGINLHYRIIE